MVSAPHGDRFLVAPLHHAFDTRVHLDSNPETDQGEVSHYPEGSQKEQEKNVD